MSSKIGFVVALLALVGHGCAGRAATRSVDLAAPRALSVSYGNIPLSFVANHGQTDAEVKFLARGQGYSLFLTPTEAVLGLRAASNEPKPPTAMVRMRLLGANKHPQLSGVDSLPGTSNYFIGNDPGRWQRDVPTYAKVKYTNVYPGIDQIYYGNQRQLEYDLVVAPAGDPRRITLAFEGVERLSLDDEGNLVLQTPLGEIKQQKPMVYQDTGGRRKRVDARYLLGENSHVRFQVASYDRTRPLVIDPVLSYSTYLGGNGNDIGHAIAVDSAGSAYITGQTLSTNFPGAGGSSIQPSKSTSVDVFVSKLNAAGSALVYSTYVGGSGGEYGYAIAVDNMGNAYVTGQTDSPTVAGTGNVPFPTVGGVQQLYKGGGDAFVTKINATGNALVYSTYLGGSGVERGYGIAVDDSGNAYVTGHTNSVNGPGDFPTSAALQPQNGGSYDAFVTKLNVAGNGLVYSTYLGGDASEYSLYGGDIAVDSTGSAYVGGSTASLNFPGASARIQATNGGGFTDGFVVRFDPAGSALFYSTYLGGNGYDEVNGLAINTGGDAFVVGYSDSPNFPTAFPLQASKNGLGNDAFVSRLNAAGTALVYSTYLGGSGGERAYDVAVDSASNAYISGWTDSSNFPTVAPLPITRGSGDAFISVLNSVGSTFAYSTYLGGSNGSEHAYGIAVDGAGEAYVTGETNATNFPSAASLQATFGGSGSDAFVAKITAPPPAVLGPPTNLLATSIVGSTVTLSWTAPVNSITPTGYVLEGGISPGGVLASLPTNSAATSYTVSVPTGSFYVRMHSVAGGTRSVASNEIRIFVNVPAPPSAPANLLGLVNGSTLALAWTNTAGGGSPTQLILDVTGSLTLSLGLPVSEGFSFPNVSAGTYTMSLRASNAVGTSASSNAVTLTFPGACTGAPATPSNLLVLKNGAVITASWGLPASGPAPTGYTLLVTGAFNGAFALNERRISGAVGSGSYTLSVVATNPCGSSPATVPQTVTIP